MTDLSLNNDDSKNEKDETGENKKEDYPWTIEHEKILVEWADKAMCYRWLHSKSNSMYNTLNALYTIPVIVISTLTGTANFAQTRVPIDYQNYFAMVVGGFNILAGIITTVQQFLKITQLNEAHRVSSIAWDKFYRNIKIELAKHPSERINVHHMLKMSKEEFDRLMETSPTIPDKIVKLFKDSFKKAEMFDVIAKPEICDALVSTDNFRNPWYSEENMEKQRREIIESTRAKEKKEKQIIKQQYNSVHDFKLQFYQLNDRWPIDSEIIDNLKDSMDMQTLKNNIIQLKSMEDNEDMV
jgi:hypothetical protein